MTLERKILRVISIFLASPISCSRVSRGISPIWVRYMRTGSSIRLVDASANSASRVRSISSPPSPAGGGRHLARVGEVHARRVVDPLGRRLGQLGLEVEVNLLALLAVGGLAVGAG